MSISQAVISGVIQGITEFFPISSSGHLVVLHSLFGIKEDMLAFDIFLHLATTISILIFFWKDIIKMFDKNSSMLKFVIIGSIPTFLIGMLFRDLAEALFTNPRLVGMSFITTGLFLFFTSYFAMYLKLARKTRSLNTVNSLIIGIAQGIAVVPGISRSGATIGTALAAGLNEETALKFSFILALPAVIGANLLKARQIYGNLVSIDTIPFLAGGIAAMITGLVAIKALFGILRKNLFFLFGVYCVFIGFSVIVLTK